MLPNKTAGLLSIQYLRAVAALLIVYQHAREFIPEHFDHLKYFNGQSGVDIFFVISGFIMAVTAAQISPKDFLLRRFIRIMPLYWLATLLAVALFFVARPLAGNIDVTVPTLIMSLLLIPHENATHPGMIVPILTQGWTLTYEMFFYATFASLLFLDLRKRILVIGLIYLCLSLLRLLFLDTRIPVFYALTNPVLLEFVGGMMIAYLYLQKRLFPFTVNAVLLILGTGVLVVENFSEYPRLIVRGITAFMIVLGLVSLEKQRGLMNIGFMRLIGDSSYSIYLSHLFMLQLFSFAWSAGGLAQSGHIAALSYVACSLAFCACTGLAVYKEIERPLLQVCKRYVF